MMFSLPLFSRPQLSREPFSRQTLAKTSRLRGAAVTESVCPYCAVGCGQLIYTKGRQVIDIEGDPRSPINEGTLCPKGAGAFQLAVNPHRVTHVMYRAPFSDVSVSVLHLSYAVHDLRFIPAPRSTHLKPLAENGKNGNGHGSGNGTAVLAQSAEDKIRQARQKGYEGDPCGECGQLTLVRSGACMKCDTCGATSGCS